MLKESKKCLQSSVFKTPGDASELMNRLSANGDQLKPFIALTKQCANHWHPLSFLSLFCKYERPCPDSDFKRGISRPHTRPWRLPEPFPSAHQTPADKSSSRWHNETHRSFQLCVKCDILCLLVSCVDTAACVRGVDRTVQTAPPLLFGHQLLRAASKPCEFLRSTVRPVYTHA